MKFWVCVATTALLAVSGCSGEDSIVAVNNPPSISFTFTPIGVPRSVPVVLTVAVSDADADDNLTISWEITRGTLTAQDAAKTMMEWDVPADTGVDTVTVTVSDGGVTRTVTAELKVGTLVRDPAASYGAASSPYILRANGTPPRWIIEEFSTTTIAAGVEFLVDLPETGVAVDGNLIVNGTSDDPVVFRANDRTLFCAANRGWWDGVLVQESGVLDFDHGEIWYADNGINLRDSGSATVNESAIKCCGSNGILAVGVGELVVTNTEISNVQSNGITVGLPATTLLPSSVTVTGCDINVNGNTGLALDLNDPFATVSILVKDNQFEFNLSHGLTMGRWVWPTIENNAFVSNGNGLSNIRLLTGFHVPVAPDSIDVQCNYWGAVISNQATIENSIYDRLDSAALGTRLLVAPWLNENPFGQPAPPPCTGGMAR